MGLTISYSGSDRFIVKYSDEDRERTLIEAVEREVEDFFKIPFSERLDDLAQFAEHTKQEQMAFCLRKLIDQLAEDEKSEHPLLPQQPRHFTMEVERFVKTHLVSRMYSLLIGYMAQAILNPDERMVLGAYHAGLLRKADCHFTPAQGKDFVSLIPDALVKKLFDVVPGRTKGSKTSEKAKATRKEKQEEMLICAAREILQRNSKAKITMKGLANKTGKDEDTISAWLGKTPKERKKKLAEIIEKAKKPEE